MRTYLNLNEFLRSSYLKSVSTCAFHLCLGIICWMNVLFHNRLYYTGFIGGIKARFLILLIFSGKDVESALGWRHHWGAWRRSFASPVIGPRRQPPFVL